MNSLFAKYLPSSSSSRLPPSIRKFCFPLNGRTISSTLRYMSSNNPLNRPSPPPLPRSEQREFEELVRKAQAPLSQPTSARPGDAEAQLAMHPDARAPLQPEFQGDTNPITGEKNGPKREPVGRWGEGDGDWSFKGRVSDF